MPREQQAESPLTVGPRVRAGGLVTVAFLKARLDEGDDHLGIFMPLVIDVLPTLANRNFAVSEVQAALAERHGVVMPQEAVTTLLKRAARRHLVVREAGRFQVNTGHPLPSTSVAGQKARIEQDQLRLGQALQDHAQRRDLAIESPLDALDMLLRLLEEEQVALLLGSAPELGESRSVSHRERAVMAEFLQDVVETDPALKSVLNGMLEGLVLYHAAFLPDLDSVERKFRDLKVVFDSVLVRQALGYEGVGPRMLMRDSIDLLRASGVRCLVFDKTVQEIQRILTVYQAKLATPAGCESLWPVPMTRHFLTQRYSPSDVQEMSALLEKEIVAAGFEIQPTPTRVAKFTSNETALAERLANAVTHDTVKPRVRHDVDCVAGVLTMRQGRRSRRIEDVGVVFATSSSLVIQSTRAWWEEDECEAGIPPLVHIRSLVNLAWLKKPGTSCDIQIRDLVALCAAGMRPSPKTWRRFIEHLNSLQASQRLSQDDVTAIIISAMSDHLLREAELDGDDPDDIPAQTLDEVVARVKSQYIAEAEKRVEEVSQGYQRRIAESAETASATISDARAAAHSMAEELRRRDLAIEGRARRWAHCGSGCIYWFVVGLVVLGAVAVAVTYSFQRTWWGIILGLAVIAATGLEVVGVGRHLSDLRAKLEARLEARLRDWLSGQARDERRG